MDACSEYVEIYRRMIDFLDSVDPDRRFRFAAKNRRRFAELSESFKTSFVKCVVGSELSTAREWLGRVEQAVNGLLRSLQLQGITFPKEFKSFREDPLGHLKKKLFNYVYDLFRGKVDLTEFVYRAGAALRTSLRTNLRSAYQVWGFVTILTHLADAGYRLLYPEHGFIGIDRHGKQRLGMIPPNVVLARPLRGSLSFFLEAPRPLSWEDTGDLERVWGLYTALRPDVMVYGGSVMNIVDLASDPPIKRPDVIVEFKELEDWYARSRDLKGYFVKSFTAEEWRSRWLKGLYDGLAEILGVRRSQVAEEAEKAKALRVREYQLVQLYNRVYQPKVMLLVSRKKVPDEVRKSLEESGIRVYDDIGFDAGKLKSVADELDGFAKPEAGPAALGAEVLVLLEELKTITGASNCVEALKTAIRILREGQELKALRDRRLPLKRG